jgi:hypothetical protein
LLPDQFPFPSSRTMVNDNEQIDPNDQNSPGSFAKSILKDLILYAFMAICAVIAIFAALNMRSWWPFAGWVVAVIAFGWWLERLER